MKTIIEKVDPARITVHYNAEKASLMYFIDGHAQFGFSGRLADKRFYESLDKGYKINLINDTMDTKKAKIRQFRAILAKKGLLDLKNDIIAQYGVSSTSDLSETQLDEQIYKLNTTGVPVEIRDMRSTILNLLKKLDVSGSKEEGWENVNNYLKQPRISGKVLYEMNTVELKDCASRLRSIIYKANVSTTLDKTKDSNGQR
jgi:hypothetical protein